MKMPTKGSLVIVDGYGSSIFAGGSNLQSDDASVLLKFEGTWHGNDLDEGYGSGIVEVDLDYFKENRIYREQLSDPTEVSVSTERRDEIFNKRFDTTVEETP